MLNDTGYGRREVPAPGLADPGARAERVGRRRGRRERYRGPMPELISPFRPNRITMPELVSPVQPYQITVSLLLRRYVQALRLVGPGARAECVGRRRGRRERYRGTLSVLHLQIGVSD